MTSPRRWRRRFARWRGRTVSPWCRPTSRMCWWRRGRDPPSWWGSATASGSSPRMPRRSSATPGQRVGDGEWFIASDASAILSHTRSVVYLDDGEMAVLTREGYSVRDLHLSRISKPVSQIEWDLAKIEKGGHDHFMLKEIFEQPETIQNTMRGHLLEEQGTARMDGLNLTDDQLKKFDRIIITACGTSWHSGLIGEYLIEELARVPVEVEYASEFRYR